MEIELLSLTEAVEGFSILIAVILFVVYMFVEALDASLIFSITKLKSFQAANKTFLLYIIWGIEIFALVANYLYIFPIAAGAWAGTYLVVEREKKKPSDSSKK